MSKKKFVTFAAAAVLILVVIWAVVQYSTNRNRSLVSPGIGNAGIKVAPQPSSAPPYNPPKEIKYGSATDLKKELDSVDPVVSESDFKDL